MIRSIVVETAALLILAVGFPLAARSQDRVVPVSLDVLAPMIGTWGAPDSVVAKYPRLADHVVHAYRWGVGPHAIDLRESFRAGHPDSAELKGLIFLDPATERIGFVAVAGTGAEGGRLFRGEYHVLADGAIERVYDVFYRSAADTPGEELGGRRRRFRETYRSEGPDNITSTLEWWLDGTWQPFGPGRYALVRLPSD